MSGPPRLIHVGFGCDNHCIFCAQGELREMELEAPVSAALEAVQVGDSVAFVGGEPTLRPELADWIERARERGASRVSVQTNGRRLAIAGVAAALRAAGTDVVEISLQGSTAAMHDFHTGVPGSFRETVVGLRRAGAAGLERWVTSVVTRSNYRHLRELVQLVAALGVRRLSLTVVQPLGRGSRLGLAPSAAMVAPHLEEALRLARSLGVGYVAGTAASGEALRGQLAGLGRLTPIGAAGAQSPEPSSASARGS